ncbi:helix-turn-helix domain-containing protein [Pseudomonas aeruginosa]|uniref:helix-turn-helix domain-containing protein n=1 Tax=Pseudomonas aeruginosa TaxID=287 RepID=UPI0018E3AA1F|nr:helix-turn-helix domain-containing protein [Pseudomonas aeruginosa]MBX5700367.1 helix-turn-helix domain-containing protein [Pseudomonas aeruginosa]MDU0680291.1 helix-turn-helix domain-containing protein [Pseudomonas aeruginosa]QQD35956.1 helix-turn-helix domain-containing protein [Pseudomonas aeruginosa]UJB87452.1 helix-turn-helix domain-containing protein [Pseudomonas aeruginosa]UJB95578.1 helix-turn-helix domain-containing protein [Pseudomonas aeruginosa]
MAVAFEHVAFPTPADASALAELRSQLVSCVASNKEGLTIELLDEAGDRQPMTIPLIALRYFDQALEQLIAGNAVSIAPIRSELTLQEGADLLNVSRHALAQLLDEGVIPQRTVGHRRRIRLADVLEYKRQLARQGDEAAAALAAQAQDLNMGYDDPEL